MSNAFRLIVGTRVTASITFGLIGLSCLNCSSSCLAQGTGNFLDLQKIIPTSNEAAAVQAAPTAGATSTDQSPTDQAPTEYPIPSPLALGPELVVRGALDARIQSNNNDLRYAFVNDAEVEAEQKIITNGEPNGKLVLQIIGQRNPNDHSSTQVQFGEAYFLYKLPIETDTKSTAYITVGQFQVPFGLLAVYDPHLLLQQPLYAESIGLRNDWGAEVSGRFYGLLNYDLAFTSGAGANHANTNGSRLVTFRLGRTFYTKLGVFNVGGSLLQGRLPNTDLNAQNPFAEDLSPTGNASFQQDTPFVNKTRVAADGTYIYRSIVARAEAMIGADDSTRVSGYYAEGEYHLSPRTGAIASSTYWKYPGQDSYFQDVSLGYSYTPQSNLIIRALYSFQHNVPDGLTGKRNNVLTLQALLRF